ncbi:MAG: glycosyltransferase family 4 protein [Vicingus serpentipes]|nr:glycosyltransferase family 4 protein [Vicingus serpentipes]
MQEVWINARFLTQQISGVQKFAIEVCKELKLINSNIRFVSPTNILHVNIAKELDVVTIGKRKGVLWEQLDLPSFLKAKNSPVLLNLCNSAPILYNKNIITIHDLAFMENPKWFSFSFRTWYNYLIPQIIKKAKHIITVSEFSKKELETKFNISENKISFVYNGLSKESVAYNTLNPEVTPRERIILSVGSINPRKNIKVLIEAFSQLNLNDYQLLIVGAENNNFNTEELISGNNQIKFLGYISDEELWKLYKKAQLFVYPSLYEGFGIPVLEALFFKCPTLVANLPVYKEVYSNFDLNYTEGNSSQSYSAAIKRILKEAPQEKKLSDSILNKCSYNEAAKRINQLILKEIQ